MNNLELEIAQLQQKIEEKKNQLEQQGGIVEEKELVGSALQEMFTGASAPSGASQPVSTVATIVAKASDAATDKDVSYLDHVDTETAEAIGLLIQKLPEIGIAKAVAEAEVSGPYRVDVLHDALVDRMYDELVQRGFIKTK
jgi:TolA-binding protein